MSYRVASVVSALALTCIVAGCSTDGALLLPEVTADSAAKLEADEMGTNRDFSLIPFITPDGYNQTVHPDYAFMPGWSPRRFLVVTPYAFGDSTLENPSLFSQTANGNWLSNGSINPIAKPRVGHLSDPDIVAVPDRNELWVYYREVTKRNTIWLIRSGDGLTWTSPRRVASAPRHMIVSPAVVRRGPEDWLMWSVNPGKEGCSAASTIVELRRSHDGVHWAPPTPVTLQQPGLSAWHIDVAVDSIPE
jgi:hypothetical protein